MKNTKNTMRNLILLSAFAAVFSVAAAFTASFDRNISGSSASSLSSVILVDAVTDNIESATETTIDKAGVEVAETFQVSSKEATAGLQKTVYTVTEYDTSVTMYTSDTVNVRAGAGTDYDKVGKLTWGSQTEVKGETDNGWYEVAYADGIAFIKGDYMVTELPSIPYLFVGDSRTVQLKMAVGTSDKAYVAKVGEGYSYFKNTALSEIQSYAGNGTTMIINFGVNDLANAGKYIKLINSNIDAWTNAGITVYYAAVTPVGDNASVSNSQIESFNARLQAELDPRIKWIDGYSYLLQTGFSYSDGLHYNKETYRSLYSYYMSVINSGV